MSDRYAPLAWTLGAVGDRWSLLVVAALLDGPARFGELQARLPAIAPNVLSARLRSLEALAAVVAEPYSARPPRYVYELTDRGRELAVPMRLLADWGLRHGEGAAGAAPRHDACGTPLETRWFCPTCRVVVDDDPADDGDVVV